MDPLKVLTPNEQNLLLFFQHCASDCLGKVATKHLQQIDFEVAERWNDAKFVLFGRIASKDVTRDFTHWCELSDDAWDCVAQLHKHRATRALESRAYERLTTKEETKD